MESGLEAESAAPPVSNAAPVGTPIGAPGLGALPWFSFDEIPLSTLSVGRVNLGNGNLLLTSNDGVQNSAIIPVRNDRFYNGLSSSSGAFGGGWSSSLSASDVGLQISGSTATYRGPNGYTAVFTASGSNWTSPVGFKATLTNESYGKKLTFNDSGESIQFNTSGWITNYKNRDNVGSYYVYENGKLAEAVEVAGRGFEIGYQTSDPTKIATVTGLFDDRQSTYTMTNGRLTRVVTPGGLWENYAYNSTGQLTGITWDFAGTGDAQILFTYDSQSRVTSIARGTTSGTMTTQTYAYTAGQTQVTNGNGKVTKYNLDSGGKVTSVIDALNRTRSQAYNANNAVTTTTDGLASGSTPGNSTLYSYDSLGNSSGVTLPTGAAAAATYALGTGCTNSGGGAYQVKCSTDSAGNGKRYDYDNNGNITKVTDTTASGTGVVEQQYTRALGGGYGCHGSIDGFRGQVCSSKDGKGNVTQYQYNRNGNLIWVRPPAPMGQITYTYDGLGRVTSVTDGNGDVTSYTYNVRDEIVTTTYDNGDVSTAFWYANGLKERDTESTDDTGPLQIYVWDALGRNTTITQKVATGGPATVANTVTYTYTYDAAGNTLSYQDSVYGKVTYGYDAANQLIAVADPTKTCTTGTGSASLSGCVKIAYDNNGAETLRTLPGNATVATVRDASGRPTRITARDTSNIVRSDIGYSYTAPGGSGPSADRTTIQTRTSFLEQGIPAGAVSTYSYDSLNRLTSATERIGSTTNASWSYAYDGAGNRVGQTRTGNTGATAGTVAYGYNAANQLTSATGSNTTWTYDAAGNQTKKGLGGQTATYDDRGAVTSISGTSYTAWGQGNAATLSRTSGGTTAGYLNSPTGLMSASDGTVRAFTRTPAGEVTGVRAASARYYYAKDHLGSTVGMFDQTGAWVGGYSYSPYGEARSTGTSTALTENVLRYIGGYFDTTTNLYRLGARYYDPSLGRFTQFDPSGQEAHPYAYAACNPINAKDPSGLSCATAVFGATLTSIDFAFAVGALVGLSALLSLVSPLSAAAVITIINTAGIAAIVALATSLIGAGMAYQAIRSECR